MNTVDLLGYLAGITVVASMLPQIIRSWKTKSTGDISLYRYVVYEIGLLMWVGYGYLVGNGPIMVMNAVGLLLAGSMIYLKLRHG